MANEPYLIVSNTEENIKKILNSIEAEPQGEIENLPERLDEIVSSVNQIKDDIEALKDTIAKTYVKNDEIEKVILEALDGLVFNGGTAKN